jgi:hypothetical protein
MSIARAIDNEHSYLGKAVPWLGRQMSLAHFLPHMPRTPRLQTTWGPLLDRTAIAKLSTAFHARSDTLTDAVRASQDRYLQGAAVIRTAHQPNYLASANIVGQATVAEHLGRLSCPDPAAPRAVHMFTLIDYDICADRRYRHARLPSPTSRDGAIALSLPPLRHVHDVFMFAETETSAPDLDRLLTDRIHNDYTLMSRRRAFNLPLQVVQERIGRIGAHLRFAADHAQSRSDFTAIVLSRIMNMELGLPTMFVP